MLWVGLSWGETNRQKHSQQVYGTFRPHRMIVALAFGLAPGLGGGGAVSCGVCI